MTVSAGEGRQVDRFRRARRDQSLAVIEGFHALKHALRFDAEILEVVCTDIDELQHLAQQLAPDLQRTLMEIAKPISCDAFERLLPRAPHTGIVALASRRLEQRSRVLEDPAPAPLVLLEEPRDMGNVGACIRVAAAAEAAGVLVTGRHDPWHPDAIRGSAGLHFALPVLWLDEMELASRPLVALDPGGQPLHRRSVPARAVLAFGSERRGLSPSLIDQAHATLAIPMREGVSSLNLATSVAAVLFASRIPE